MYLPSAGTVMFEFSDKQELRRRYGKIHDQVHSTGAPRLAVARTNHPPLSAASWSKMGALYLQTASVSAVRVLPVMRTAGTCRARFKPRVTSSLEPTSSWMQLQNSANPIAESHHLSLCFPLPLSEECIPASCLHLTPLSL